MLVMKESDQPHVHLPQQADALVIQIMQALKNAQEGFVSACLPADMEEGPHINVHLALQADDFMFQNMQMKDCI